MGTAWHLGGTVTNGLAAWIDGSEWEARDRAHVCGCGGGVAALFFFFFFSGEGLWDYRRPIFMVIRALQG